MNVLSRIAVLTLSVTGLAACASTDDQMARVAPPSTIVDADAAYVSRVEAIARRRGIEVVWVNPPSTEKPRVAQQD